MGCGCGQKKVISMTSVQMQQAQEQEQARRTALEQRIAAEQAKVVDATPLPHRG